MYYVAFMISWALSGLLARKYKVPKGSWLLSKLETYVVSFFLMLGILAFMIYEFNLTNVSRLVILNSLLISFSTEIGYLLYKNKSNIGFKNINHTYNSKVVSFEVLLFGIINLYIIYKLTGNISFNTQNLLLFISFYLSWFLGSFLGHQFHPTNKEKNYLNFIWQYIKAYLIILALVAFSAFINKLVTSELTTIVYGITTYSLLSFISVSCYYYIKKYRISVLNIAGFPVKGISGDILLTQKYQDMNNHYRSSFNTNDSELLNSKLKNLSLKRFPEIFEFLDESIDLKSIDNSYSAILKSDDISNIDFLPDDSLQLLLNLQKINHLHSINEYLDEVNRKLMKEGIFVGNFNTAYLRHQRFLKNYPYYFAQLFYFIDFLWNRVFAKIILLKKIYKGLTGRNYEALTLSEGLGRLYFCGFEVLHLKIIKDTMFFISKKIKEPSHNGPPSTGLLFHMKRIGKDGKMIDVYKFRTMYPYSEYLQEYLLEKFGYDSAGNGKVMNDFRVTRLGKIMRKYWIDELPQLINVIKGEMKLIGVRPLSQARYNEFPDDLKNERIKYKPGCIPPYVSLRMPDENENIEAERIYIKDKLEHPFLIDIKYFYLAIYNILIKKLRSA
ncbi:MAG: sugar transferase [Promethearchaeota archaeon]